MIFGDVWVCSGQSNMEFSMGGGHGWDGNGIFNSTEEIAFIVSVCIAHNETFTRGLKKLQNVTLNKFANRLCI